MLNAQGERELAYLVTVGKIEPMFGYDSLELATVNGWTCVVGKGSMKEGDLAVYFEIDSKLPEVPPFSDNMAIVKYKYKVKTQRFGRGGIKYLSQGLLMPFSDFPALDPNYSREGDFLTSLLGVTYYEIEDNTRKANNEELIKMKVEKKMLRWKKKHPFLSKFSFFVKLKVKIYEKQLRHLQKKKKTDWPAWVVKTDEERVQNLPMVFQNLEKTWFVTEKIDGTSTTFTMKQAATKKRELIICSRNVVFNTPEKEDRNYYKDTDGNVYLEMAAKYKMYDVLSWVLDKRPELEWITIQGETYGGSIQKRKYCDEHRFAIFNVIYKNNGEAPQRLNPKEMIDNIEWINKHLHTVLEEKLETVPYLGNIQLKDYPTCDELLAYAAAAPSKIDKGMREGIVLRSENGVHSFKAVSNEFLLKYHN